MAVEPALVRSLMAEAARFAGLARLRLAGETQALDVADITERMDAAHEHFRALVLEVPPDVDLVALRAAFARLASVMAAAVVSQEALGNAVLELEGALNDLQAALSV